jgi:glutaredoxin
MHVHHPPQSEDDSYHVVALTSTTLGTLKQLNSPKKNSSSFHGVHHHHHVHDEFKFSNGKVEENESFRFHSESLLQKLNKEKEKEKNEKKEALVESDDVKVKEFSMGLVEAKTWSNMIEEKLTKVVPMTPTRTPPGEPETINTWELMEGLEDISPYRSPNHIKSFSFHVNGDVVGVNVDPPKPFWLEMTEEESKLNPAISDFDPEVISSFKKSLQNLSQDSPFHLRETSIDEENMKDDVFVDVKVGEKNKVVLYFTSLRGVRKTYEDCCQVRMILRGLGVKIDERDVSMHLGFKEELRDLLGDLYGGGGLPRVFVGRNYIGGIEEIEKLNEDGKLEKLLYCCEKIEDSCGECENCGDIRFVPCETCFGSCKIYYEGGDDEEEEYDDHGGEEGEFGFHRCPDCNENGLIRCSVCCY